MSVVNGHEDQHLTPLKNFPFFAHSSYISYHINLKGYHLCVTYSVCVLHIQVI